MILEYDTVIVGSSLDAFLLSAQNFSPVVFSDFRIPFRFDYFEPDVDLSFLCLPDSHGPKSLTTFTGEVDVGIPKHIVWERLAFVLAMNGLSPLSNLCTNLRIEDRRIICSNEYSKIAEIHFNECIYMGDDSILDRKNKNLLDNVEYLCYDWIAFNKGGKHEIDFFETDDGFINKVWFYPSDRIDGNTPVRDACAVSSLTVAQLNDFNYSGTMARFKLIHEMEKRGMKGLFNGYGPNGNPKYYKFKTTHTHRERRRSKEDKDDYPAGTTANQIEQKDLLKSLSQNYMDYHRFLRGLDEQSHTHSGNNTSS